MPIYIQIYLAIGFLFTLFTLSYHSLAKSSNLKKSDLIPTIIVCLFFWPVSIPLYIQKVLKK